MQHGVIVYIAKSNRAGSSVAGLETDADSVAKGTNSDTKTWRWYAFL
jgi:hypothetical protein